MNKLYQSNLNDCLLKLINKREAKLKIKLDNKTYNEAQERIKILSMKEYRKNYETIKEILKKHGKARRGIWNNLISLKLNTIETILFNCDNGYLVKTIKDEPAKVYYENNKTIKCTLLELRTLLEQLKFKFNEK